MIPHSPAAPAVLALDLGGTKLAAAIGHPGGALSRRRSIATDAEAGAPDVLERALALARTVLEDERAAGGTCAAVGVATMGITHEDGTLLAPNVAGWGQLVIPAAVRRAFPGLAVAIDNDVRAGARAELAWGALRGVDVGAYLNLGTGISAGLVVGGRVIAGAHGAAGEVGYSLFGGWRSAKLAAEGGVPSEERYGGRGVQERARAELNADADFAQLLAARDEDGAVAGFLDELFDGIAALAANLAITLDPEVLVLGGGYLRTTSTLLDHVAAVVARAVPFPPHLSASRFGADASLAGAAALALDAVGAGR